METLIKIVVGALFIYVLFRLSLDLIIKFLNYILIKIRPSIYIFKGEYDSSNQHDELLTNTHVYERIYLDVNVDKIDYNYYGKMLESLQERDNYLGSVLMDISRIKRKETNVKNYIIKSEIKQPDYTKSFYVLIKYNRNRGVRVFSYNVIDNV